MYTKNEQRKRCKAPSNKFIGSGEQVGKIEK